MNSILGSHKCMTGTFVQRPILFLYFFTATETCLFHFSPVNSLWDREKWACSHMLSAGGGGGAGDGGVGGGRGLSYQQYISIRRRTFEMKQRNRGMFFFFFFPSCNLHARDMISPQRSQIFAGQKKLKKPPKSDWRRKKKTQTVPLRLPPNPIY